MHRIPFVAAIVLAAIVTLASGAAANPPVDRAAIVATIKADMASIIDGINAHDAQKATSYDAPDMISMEAGRPSTTGAEADRSGMAMAMKYVPSWRVHVLEESIDLAESGDMAVYRCTANQEFTADDGTPMVERMNYLAELKRGPGGAWNVAWSMVAPMEKPHKK